MRNKSFQCKRDKMHTMSAFNASLITLVNLYADQFDKRQDTKVYNNGAMQVCVFVSVNYNGDTDEDDIKDYVQKNVVIYSLTHEENVKWKNSTTDNGFLHDIEHDSNRNAPKLISDLRVPLYFTVPGGTAEGEHKWMAKMGDKKTDEKTPLTITVKAFRVSADDFEIVDRADVGCVVLRVLKYKNDAVPGLQKLQKCTEYKGVKFSKTGGNTWVSMAASNKGFKLGGFVEYKTTSNIKIATTARTYSQKHDVVENEFDQCDWDYIAPYCDCYDDTSKIKSDDLISAWNEGVVMIMVHDYSVEFICSEWDVVYLFHANDISFDQIKTFDFQDTFGGRVRIKINWDNGDWWGSWAVESAEVVYP